MPSEALTKLLILQDRDLRLLKIEGELKQIPLEQKQVANRLVEQSKQYQEHKAEALRVETARKELELEVNAKQELIKKYQKQQMETKRNEEYQALGNEIKHAEETIVKLEDQELELMEEYEKAQADLEEEGKNVKTYEAAATSRKQELEDKSKNLEQQKTETVEAIKKAEADAESSAPKGYKLYKRISVSKPSNAIVQVVHGNVCNGCHMQLSPQVVVDAKSGRDDVLCPECSRLLYWPEASIHDHE